MPYYIWLLRIICDCGHRKRGSKTSIKMAAPHYEFPSRQQFTCQIDAKYETLSQKVKDQLAEVKASSSTSDSWTEVKTVPWKYFERRKIHLACFDNTLQWVGSNAMNFTSGLSNLISRVKKIVTYFKHSANVIDELKSLQLFQGETERTLREHFFSSKNSISENFKTNFEFLSLKIISGCEILSPTFFL